MGFHIFWKLEAHIGSVIEGQWSLSNALLGFEGTLNTNLRTCRQKRVAS